MREKIYNLFPIFDENEVCSSIGYVIHDVEGTDDYKFEFLQREIDKDFESCLKFYPSVNLTRSEYNASDRLNILPVQIEELFKYVGASEAPLFIRTPIVNGKVFFNASTKIEDYSMDNIREQMGVSGTQIDWLLEYTSDEGIDLIRLINDDYFKAIKLLYSNGLYVSAMKLLLTCIDSLAYIEYGSDRKAFIKWLKEYSNIEKILISAEELWELRNGLLHMTNLHSSRVVQKTVRRISFYINSEDKDFKGINEEDVFYFNFEHLIDIYISAVLQWLDSYNNDREKFLKFVERYDQTVSDSRHLLRKK
ncbi:TPA: hypothetical protein ACJK7N_002492 [Acinetobacter baumannii]|nr:hypothetical protein [Acinetobacter baumannii]